MCVFVGSFLVCVYECGGHLPPLKQSLSLAWNLPIRLGPLASELQGPDCAQDQLYKHIAAHLAFSHGFWGSNSGPLACKATLYQLSYPPSPSVVPFYCDLVWL